MRYILIILVFLSVGANAQMVIKAHANYRPYAQPAANLLLDDYPNAAAAYSLRKLDKDYTGAAIRVRKDTTGQPEQDIGFTASGDLDTAALKSFLNARSGFVTTWYDQSGSGRNATQSTAANQPRIALNGVIDRGSASLNQSTRPRVFFNNTFAMRLLTSSFSMTGDVSAFSAYMQDQSGGFISIAQYGETAVNYKMRNIASWNGGGGSIQRHTISVDYFLTASNPRTDTITLAKSHISSTIFDVANQLGKGALDNKSLKSFSMTMQNPASSIFTIGGQLGGGVILFNGGINEIIYYNSNQETNRTGINTNMNTYYSIY